MLISKATVYAVNACVILRRNNFDPPVIFFPTLTPPGFSLPFVLPQSDIDATTPPCGRSSPPGHAVVDGWRRDERTRDIPQSLPRSLVSSAKPTTGVQVVRACRPHCLDSLTPDAHRAGPLHPRAPCGCSRSGCPLQRRRCLRQLTFDPLLSTLSRASRRSFMR